MEAKALVGVVARMEEILVGVASGDVLGDYY